MSKRFNSSIINLRIFHNWIKNEVLTNITDIIKDNYEELNILELAVGKANDLYKWSGVEADTVIGIDINKDYIHGKDGAYQRYNKFTKRAYYKKRKVPKCKFYVYDLTEPETIGILKKKFGNTKFHIVSCQFALHYFFKDQSSLENVLKIVSKFLHHDGYFIGTTLDSNRINSLFMKGDIVKKDIYYLENKTDLTKTYTPYNNEYIVSLGKKGEDHYFSKKPSHEYMVDVEELKNVCESFGLQYVEYKPFCKLYEKYKSKEPDHLMSDEEKEYSFLNFTFVFNKI